jgi:cystathionine beta-lyase
MSQKRREATLLTHAGNDPAASHGAVNPPVIRASTIVFPTVEAMEHASAHPFDAWYYARIGTPTSRALETAVAALAGGHRAVTYPSGAAACAGALCAVLKAGDHLLMTDSAYGPTRFFCDDILAGFGIQTTYYDPLIGEGIAALFRPNTRAVYMESPGSLTFEVQDVPAITAAAAARKVTTLIDNTWATPHLFKPLAHGVDFEIQAATKYIGGHADLMLGLVIPREEQGFLKVKAAARRWGQCAGPDDTFMALRGLRTLAVRMPRHQENALAVATWLKGRPEVARVLYPALADDPGHTLWRRDFKGASGLFGVVLKPRPKAALTAMLDGMELFPMGDSWGGYESLIQWARPARIRTAVPWRTEGTLLRIHVGLEDPEDLIEDLERGLARLTAA